jgi:excisionase family DNA binding protein
MPARERLLTSGEVAQLFRVDPKTVTRWAAAGRIRSIRTPGGHRRFPESHVRALLRGEEPDLTPSEADAAVGELLGEQPVPVGHPAGAAVRAPASPATVPSARAPVNPVHGRRAGA